MEATLRRGPKLPGEECFIDWQETSFARKRVAGITVWPNTLTSNFAAGKPPFNCKLLKCPLAYPHAKVGRLVIFEDAGQSFEDLARRWMTVTGHAL